MKSLPILDGFLPTRRNIPAIATDAIPMASAIGCKDCLDSQGIRYSCWQKVHFWGLSSKTSYMSQPVSCFISGGNSISGSMFNYTCSSLFQAKCYSDFYPRHNTAAAAAAATAWCGNSLVIATRLLWLPSLLHYVITETVCSCIQIALTLMI